jgi:hypothetical protein
MHQGTASTRKASAKARVVLMLDEGADRNLRVLAAMQKRTKSGLVEELIANAVAAEQARAGKAA